MLIISHREDTKTDLGTRMALSLKVTNKSKAEMTATVQRNKSKHHKRLKKMNDF